VPEAGAVRQHAGAAIHSVAAALPEGVVENAPIAERLGVDERWIVKRTGVSSRRRAAPDARLADLAVRAGQSALDRADLAAGDVDLVLVATSTADDLMPNAAPLVADALGAKRAGAFDVGAACHGFLGALTLAAGQAESGRIDHALVIGADVMSRYVDADDPRSAALIGDGAGALVVSRHENGRGVGPTLMRVDGHGAELVHMRRTTSTFVMEGQGTFRFAVEALASSTQELLEETGRSLDDVDLFVYHQANSRILSAVGARLDLPPEKVINTVAWTGNTIAASIPVALADADAQGRLGQGTRLLLGAIGAGFVWGTMLAEWGLPEGNGAL
jgi:3-oxoacyl-[acyl-carrier-protein] synthase-3